MTGRTRSARLQPKWLRPAALLVFLLAISWTANAADKDPLRPPDTSSSRATLQGFIGATDDTYSRMVGVLEAYASSDRLFPSVDERRNQIATLRDAPRALQFLDLSGIAPVLKDTVAIERLLQLKEVLDRIDIPAYSDIPDAAAMAQMPSKRWRLPNTEIDIVLEDKGDRAGEYLVSAATIERLPEFYQRVEDLPHKPGPGQRLAEVYSSISHGGAPTIYEAFLDVSHRAQLHRPAALDAEPAGLGKGPRRRHCRVAVAGSLPGLPDRWARHLRWPPSGASRRCRQPRGAVCPMARVAGPRGDRARGRAARPFFATLLRIGGSPRVVVAYASTGAVYLSAAWLTMVIAVLLGEIIVTSEHLTSRSLDSQLSRLGTRLLGLVAAIAILIKGGDELGFPAYSQYSPGWALAVLPWHWPRRARSPT